MSLEMSEVRPAVPAAPTSDADRPAPAAGARPDPRGLAAAPPLPAVTMPKAGGAIRGMGEKFETNAANGTGVGSVPIATSPGRAGFGPQLSLSYDSGRGNGPFGFGWSLPVPSITRKTDKGLPRYADAEESDVFLLSNGEDLVPCRSAPQWTRERLTEPAWAPGYQVDRYRPRIEHDFTRIERWTRLADGDAHWRTISVDNVTSWYGEDDSYRVRDPHDPARVFSWLISRSADDRGNLIRYDYLPEDDRGVDLTAAHERNRDTTSRSANRYLKRIRYGNRVSALSDSAAADPGWMFEVVLDYGDHPADSPAPQPSTAWASRDDPFSSYRSGFEVRSYRLCQRILMFHHFPDEPDVGADCLVRSTDLSYQTGQAAGAFLTTATQCGYRRAGDGYVRGALPPVEFGYSPAVLHGDVAELAAEDLANLPAGLAADTHRFVDLDGEGIAGFLARGADGWYYKANLGAARFAPGRLISPVPATGGTGFDLVDLSGDGRPDLAAYAGPTPGYFTRTGGIDDGWAPFAPFAALPVIDWTDPNLRFVDLDGDGLADVLITEQAALRWYQSHGRDGFAAAGRRAVPEDEERGPRLLLSDGTGSVYLADMSGDGLSDVVRVRNGEVCYWPNLGYGRFGAKVSMDGAPWFDRAELFDQRRVRLVDVDGSGVTDIVYLGADGVRVHLNRNGNGFAPAQTVSPLSTVDDVAVVDLLGTGTSCLVWSSNRPADGRRAVRYIDLLGGVKPHLLTSVSNNLGAQTTVEYAPSTAFYLADKAAGRPWLTRLPFPVQVVARVTTYDRVSRCRYVRRFAYHHGYFDPVDREFRGFGMVEQWDTEEIAALSASVPEPGVPVANEDAASHTPPVLTRTWFHTGASVADEAIVSSHFAADYWREPGVSDAQHLALLLDDTVWPSTLRRADGSTEQHEPSAAELREACRALKGSMLRRETYALDGSPAQPRPYQVSEHNHTIELMQPCRDGDRHPVCFPHDRETLIYQYERAVFGDDGLPDPRVSHELTLEVDGFGNPLSTVTVAYPRRHPEVDRDNLTLPSWAADAVRTGQTRTLATATLRRYTDPIGADGTAYRAPLPCETRTYELTGLPTAPVPDGPVAVTARYPFDKLAPVPASATDLAVTDTSGGTGAGPHRRLVEHARTLYRADDLSAALPLGTAQPLALPYETYRLAYTTDLLSTGFGDRLANPAILGAEGGYQSGDQARGSGLFPATDPAGQWWTASGRPGFSPDPGDPPATEAGHAAAHFYRPVRMRDPFGAVSTLTYDRYDLLPAQARDPLGNLTTAGEHGPDGTLVTAGNDYRVLQARLVMDANRNRTATAFDTVGRVVATAVMGKPEQQAGDSLDGVDPDPAPTVVAAYLADPLAAPGPLLGSATTRVVYDLTGYQRTRDDPQPQPAVAATLTREVHVADLAPDAVSPIRHRLGYSDGFGRQIQLKAQVRPGPVDGADQPTRWVSSGWVVYNNKGLPVRRYEPFFTVSHQFEFAVAAGVSPVICYDPLGRVVATLNPDDSYAKVVVHPWRQDTWDANDTVLLDPRTDPDPRAVATAALGGLPSTWKTWYGQRSTGVLGPAEATAASQAAAHAGTPTSTLFDPLGRAFVSVAHHRDTTGDAFYPTVLTLDIEGTQRAIQDAKGATIVQRELDLLGRTMSVGGADAGFRRTLRDGAGQPIRSWDDRDHAVRLSYDALRRPQRRYVRTGSGPERLVERSVYGEADPDPMTGNLRGRMRATLDDAGLARVDGYDFKGNPLVSARRVRTAWQGPADWSTLDAADDAALLANAAAALLEPAEFTVRTSYDAVNRPATVTHPDGSILRHTYDEAGLPLRLDAQLSGDQTWTPFVTDSGYDAHGRRVHLALGNGTSLDYRYDPHTFRLTGQRAGVGVGVGVGVGGRTVQDMSYTYDPVGNITEQRDGAQQTVFFAGAVVEPTAGYTYDPLYRLIGATGREHVGQQSQPPSAEDPPTAAVPHPNDLAAMRRYTEQYGWDEVGNLLSLVHQANGANWTRTFTYAAPSRLPGGVTGNRLTGSQVGAGPVEAYGYDPHGNTVATPQLATLDWDDTDRLEHVDRGGGGAAWYSYDGHGQRVRKVLSRPNGTRSAQRLYLAGFELYQEYDGSGQSVTLARQTLHVSVAGKRMAMVDTRTAGTDGSPARVVRYQLDNHAGSACVELNGSGEVLSYEEYFPFGSTSFHSARSGAAPPKRYRYVGKERDEETGFTYFGARYYAPWLCRWISVEPAGLPDGVNAYIYARNNPIRYADPDGNEARLIVDPASHTVTVQTTVHLYAATNAQAQQMQAAATAAQGWWTNPTVATQAQVQAAANAKTPVTSSGLTATIAGQQWTLKFDVTYQVHQNAKSPINVSTAANTVYDVDPAKAKTQGYQVGDNAMTLVAAPQGSKIGGEVKNFTVNNTQQANLTGEVQVPTGATAAQIAVRLQHETGHMLGLDERYDPVTANFFIGGYPGFDYDVMGSDNGYSPRVLDPTHVQDYLAVGAGLAAAQGNNPTTKTYLLSGHVDDTKKGTLTTGAQGYAAARTAARTAAIARIQTATTDWENRKTAPRNDGSDYVPEISFGVINTIVPPAPPAKKQPAKKP